MRVTSPGVPSLSFRTRDGPFTASALCTTPVIVLIVISDTFTHSVKDLGVSGAGPAERWIHDSR